MTAINNKKELLRGENDPFRSVSSEQREQLTERLQCALADAQRRLYLDSESVSSPKIVHAYSGNWEAFDASLEERFRESGIDLRPFSSSQAKGIERFSGKDYDLHVSAHSDRLPEHLFSYRHKELIKYLKHLSDPRSCADVGGMNSKKGVYGVFINTASDAATDKDFERFNFENEVAYCAARIYLSILFEGKGISVLRNVLQEICSEEFSSICDAESAVLIKEREYSRKFISLLDKECSITSFFPDKIITEGNAAYSLFPHSFLLACSKRPEDPQLYSIFKEDTANPNAGAWIGPIELIARSESILTSEENAQAKGKDF